MITKRRNETDQRIGQYELRGLLGEGGIGQVYVARDTVLGRQAAIKTLRPEFARDRNFLDRFFTEAQSLANLNHQNITTLYGFEAHGPRPFMAMELVRGHTLASLLGRLNRIPMRESLAVLAQAAAGLTYAHGEGIVHRDIKPENLMITERGLVKIMDFGIARVAGAKRLTRAGQIFGTLFYASPEQIRGGEIDQRSDLYSLAVVLYEMLVGAPPFTSENEHALMTAHLDTTPPPLSGRVPGLSAPLEAAIMRALAKRPEDRFASADAFARAAGIAAVRGEETEILQQLVVTAFRNTPPPATRFVTTPGADGGRGRGGEGGEPIVVPAEGSAPPPSLWKPAILVAGLVLALGIGAGYLLLSPPAPNPPDKLTVTQPANPSPPAPTPTSPKSAPTEVAATEPASPAPSTLPPAGERAAPPGSATAPSGLPPSPIPPAVQPAARQVAISEPAPNAPPPRPGPEPPSTSTTLIPANPDHDQSGSPPAEGAPGPVAALPVPSPINPPSPPAPQPELPVPQPIPVTTEMPSKQPDLAGLVTGIASASILRITGRKDPIELWGIKDPTLNGEHQQAVHDYLKQLSRGHVECFHHKGDHYQCFAGGQDLALVALQRGLARPTADAPAEYRALAQ